MQVQIVEGMTIKDISDALGVRIVDVIKCLIRLGEEPKTISHPLSVDSAEFVVTEFKCTPIRKLLCITVIKSLTFMHQLKTHPLCIGTLHHFGSKRCAAASPLPILTIMCLGHSHTPEGHGVHVA